MIQTVFYSLNFFLQRFFFGNDFFFYYFFFENDFLKKYILKTFFHKVLKGVKVDYEKLYGFELELLSLNQFFFVR
jgi:hypothetical protein